MPALWYSALSGKPTTPPMIKIAAAAAAIGQV
jgi:hypothetical protein